ncbi:MAG: hypothetical protein KGR26_15425 [Cyanobacteria bacterium REEB65]|nr:hypothetical protein [Cyanobacteria bacterium REEB65]
MESWRKVWREAIAPQLSNAGLRALELALRHDCSQLIQGTTVRASADPIQPCAACAIAYAGWIGDGLRTLAEVHEYFATVAHEAGGRLGEMPAVRYFTNWFDETPREEMRRELLAEVRRELARRKGQVAA